MLDRTHIQSTGFRNVGPAGARIGIDLVHVARIAESVATFGDRFTHRLFAAGELRDIDAADVAARGDYHERSRLGVQPNSA